MILRDLLEQLAQLPGAALEAVVRVPWDYTDLPILDVRYEHGEVLIEVEFPVDRDDFTEASE